MNELQQPLPPHRLSRTGTSAADTASSSQDDDIALGCECADPALQIERWAQEGAPQAWQSH